MLEARSVNLHYGAAQALRGVSMVAEAGKITCILGRNGVGKTSLLRALTGHQPISRRIDRVRRRRDRTVAPYERARQGIAYVPQGRDIFPLLTVEENLHTGFSPLNARSASCPTRCSIFSRCWPT